MALYWPLDSYRAYGQASYYAQKLIVVNWFGGFHTFRSLNFRLHAVFGGPTKQARSLAPGRRMDRSVLVRQFSISAVSLRMG